MGAFWCDKGEHMWDDPDDLENTFCLNCTLEPKQAKEIARIEAANQSLRGKAYSPHLDDEGDPILWRALEADCDMIRMTLEDELKQLREALHQDGHTIIFTGDGWSIQHPVECRPDMTSCEIHQYMNKLQPFPSEGMGTFNVGLCDGVIWFEALE